MTIYHGGGASTPSYTLPTNRWIHFTIVKESASSIKVYAEGTLLGTYSAFAGSVSSTNFSYIGDPSAGAYVGEGYWDNFSLGVLDASPSNVAFADDFEDGDASGWNLITSGGGTAGVVRLGHTYALHAKASSAGAAAMLTSPYFALDNSQYSFEFDYYKPAGVAAKDWHIYGSWNNQANWNDIRILQSDDVVQGRMTIYYGSSLSAVIDGALPTDQWVRFAVVKNEAGNLQLYINGVHRGTYAPLNTTAGLSMNFGYLGDPSSGAYYGEGYWDNFRVATATNASTIYTTNTYGGGDSRLIQIATPGSSLEFSAFSSYPSNAEFPGFTENSTVRSVSLMDTHPEYHFGGLRWAGRAYNGTLHSHVPFKLDVLQSHAKVSVFRTRTDTASFNPLKATSTYYVFHELPEAMLVDTEIERVICAACTNGFTTYVFSYQAYAKGTSYGTPKYDGTRLWFDDPNPPGVPWFSGTGIDGNQPVNPDGTNGVYLRYWAGNPGPDIPNIFGLYFDPQQWTRGMNLQQNSSGTNWSSNPPTGFIFDKDKAWGEYITANEAYYGVVPTIELDDLPNVGDKDSEQMLIYFGRSGASSNLSSLSDIYNLEASFRNALQMEELVLTTSSRPVVQFSDTASQARDWQVVVMPAAFAQLIPDAGLNGNYYLGAPQSVALLKDVAANGTRTIGVLPIDLVEVNSTTYTVDSYNAATLADITIQIQVPSGQVVSSVTFGGSAVGSFTQIGDLLSFTQPIPAGETTINLTF